MAKMKYIKLFEKKIELIGYPEGNIIRLNKNEFDKLRNAVSFETGEEFDIRWDNEGDYQENCHGQWRFMNDEEEEIEDWLEFYRELKDVDAVEDARKIKNDADRYNI